MIGRKPNRQRADLWDSKEYNTAVKRLGKMSNAEILEWLDQAGTGMEGLVANYRRTGDIEYIHELAPSISVIQAAVEELIIRD